ncbi:pre-60S factor rei1 [Lodderomyces elongisporus]|uniref:pre-60S factor rei1 n=1 Tax=Lodderomyces elongisporus TaxID=36914 RepID=UPI002925AD82|nr:pre-60S factor rei1 [Lodderomyces elongisporus]WLF78025.1 pre-60S factor rei1 [Lodderomyces elongisporus]
MFTCNTCNLQFPASEDQRTHMKSEWHRYNLKRKVAQLPPINEDLFNSKVAAAAAQKPDDGTKEKHTTKKEQRRKEKAEILEKKRAILEQAKKAMLAEQNIQGGEEGRKLDNLRQQTGSTNSENSTLSNISKTVETDDNKDNEEVQKTQDTHEGEGNGEGELDPEHEEEKLLQQKLANKLEIPPTSCLFAHPKYGHNFNTVDENAEHMFKQHGLYLPEPTYLVDKQGLIEYLAEKIGFGFCIACNYQGKNAEAAREHMQTKRHMRIPYESEDEKLEISKFYDFSSTYDDYRNNSNNNSDSSTQRKPSNVISEGDDGEDEEEWEDVSGDEDVDSDEEELPPVENDAIYRAGNELILPSGAIVGHRSNARYYRQNLAPERELSEGQGTVIAAETRHMLSLRDRVELAEKKRTWKSEKKREDINDRRAAKFINNQPHFRDQLLQ